MGLNLNIELRDLVRRIVQNEFEDIYGIACKVSNVRELPDEGWVCDCEPINKKPIIRAVRLKAESDGEILVIPSDGSVVFVTLESDDEAFISMYGRIDSIQFFDGSNDGLINIQDLVSKLNKYEELFTQLQNDLVTNWTVVPSDGGLALQVAILAGFGIKEIPDTEQEELEDDRITH